MSPPANMPPILFQDERFIVIDKPPGLPVHAGPRGGPSVEDFFPFYSRRRDGPWLAHRLDADTSGCLAIALRRAALHEAQAAFAAGRVEKRYWAVVEGVPGQDEGVIDAPLLKRSSPAGGWRMLTDPAGLAASTRWRVLGRTSDKAWLELRPLTGRTHQIRAHCAHMGHPLLGDPIYGGGQGRLLLLARSLRLPLAPAIEALAHPPPHMDAQLRSFTAYAAV
jgi:tRNA pseudouridine32 synthase/23S rRNA pseudouridine746 synthase